jgi:hypothetical protein
VLAARRMVAQGRGVRADARPAGLPPERTFSPLLATDGFRVERSDHYQVGVERDLRSAFVVAFRAYGQNVDDQLSTLFHVRSTTAGPADLGHYYVATAGDVRTRGWAASVSHEVGGVRSVEYAQSRAELSRAVPAGRSRTPRRRPCAMASRTCGHHHTVRAAIRRRRPGVLYRISNWFAHRGRAHRCAVQRQINQRCRSNFSSAGGEISSTCETSSATRARRVALRRLLVSTAETHRRRDPRAI